MNYVLRNPPLVYRHQRAGRPATYRAERTSETYERWCRSTASSNNSGHTYSSGAAITKKHNLIKFSNYTNYVNCVNYNHFLKV
jgi:hypothetical protein